MRPSFRILLVVSQSELRKQLISSLQTGAYFIETVETAKAARAKIEDQHFDLVICQQILPDKSGFRLYKILEEQFCQCNTGFFMILEDYSLEDLQLGLEVGIDNFIFSPIQPDSLINKVDKQLRKSLQFNYYESERFRMQFHSSPVAMFFSENLKITEVNDPFSRLFDFNNIEETNAGFFDVFEINGDKENRLKLRKLENGLIDYCWLEDVSVVGMNENFNLYKNSIGDRNKNKLLTMVLPNYQHKNGDNRYDAECVEWESCMKNSNKDFRPIEDVRLTSREQEVFTLSARGIPIKQIALHLNISERTIEKHRSNIMKKTETHSMMEAILKIQKQQLLFSIK